MNLHDEIRRAYDNVHAPDDLTERLKQELYQKDFHKEAEELTCEAVEAPSRSKAQILRQSFGVVAAALALCIGCGFMLSTMREHVEDFHPGAPVVVPAPTQETTEPTTEPAA